MAEQQSATFSNKPVSAKQKEVDFAEHERTYGAFMRLTKWGVIAVVALLAILYLTLVY
ncbi:aa3-type cytochrome c oxidase subunit IV [Pelagibacterium xiamenense]|uniref:aa3-type cytochrome c oxidase subunit IV n=1 Tax=Pelagibacterium xiamenense TaxID=2901140 RepID=UPI001E2B0457|nr:aa3-type cytochrome c oxidase subunit IV [Pelagibacterium xiamenense]MCD7060506.1 aa3-type cytochrome c oxidase subunit IV [Pelagibacterium xiamenense]